MKRPEPELFLDDHRGHYIARDFAQCIKRERLIGVSDEDLDTLAAYDAPCPKCTQEQRDANTPANPSTCDICYGTGETDGEICDEIFTEICDNALVLLECDYTAIPRDPGTRDVFLDALREGRTREATRIVNALADDELTSLSKMATVRSQYSRAGNATAWPEGSVECILDHAEAEGNPLKIVLGRVEMIDGACWLIPLGMEWSDDDQFYRWPDEETDEPSPEL